MAHKRQIDRDEAMASGRAVAVTEFGSNSNRVPTERNFLERWIVQRRAFATFRWALDMEDRDRGIGDTRFGWMKWMFGDFDAITAMLRDYRAKL